MSLELELTTERLILRPLVETDAARIEELINFKEILRNTLSMDYPYPPGGGITWIKQQQERLVEGKAFVFSISRGQNPGLIGVIGFEVSQIHQRGELGYWMGLDFWGQGYCTEAAQRVLRFGFEDLGLHKMHADYMARNPASGRVLEKIGMRREGLLRQHIRKWGVFEDVMVMGLLAQDFQKI